MIKYNITDIRRLLYLSIIILLTFLCVLIAKARTSIWASIPLLFTFSLFNFQMESLDLLFFNDFFLMIVGSIAIIVVSMHSNKYYEEIFVLLGSVLAFTSMFMVPLIVLSFPLIVALLYTSNGESCGKRFFKYTVAWGWGYAITMATKVLLSVCFVQSDRGLTQISHYLGNDKYTFVGRISRIVEVWKSLFWCSEISRHLVIAIIVALVIFIVIKRRNSINLLGKYWPVGIMLLFPAMWCFFCAGHSTHGWTVWNWSIAVFALLGLLFKMCGFDGTEEKC